MRFVSFLASVKRDPKDKNHLYVIAVAYLYPRLATIASEAFFLLTVAKIKKHAKGQTWYAICPRTLADACLAPENG